MSFFDHLDRAASLLQANGRISHRALRLELGLDNLTFLALRDELVRVRGIAVEEDDALVAVMNRGKQPWSIDAAPHHREAERRRITILFCDLVASTALSASRDPEDLHDMIRQYRCVCHDAVLGHGGTISQWIGDGIDAYFGYPSAHENDAILAIDAARDILRAMAILSDEVEHTHGTPLAVRIGIHTGPVVVGDIDGHGNAIAAVGETPNVCARIKELAPLSTIVISEATKQLVRGFYQLKPLGAHAIRGLPRSIPLFEVVSARELRNRIEVGALDGLTPLVDRDDERALLECAARVVERGAGAQVVTLCGEPGIGKSRLVYHVRKQLQEAQWDIFECRCSPSYLDTALHPIREALRQRFTERDGVTGAYARIAEALADLGPERAQSAALIAEFLEVPGGNAEAVPPTTPQRRRQRIFETVVALVRSCAARAPMLMIVEDLQWADPSTLECLGIVLDQTARERVFTLLTRRPDAAISLGAREADCARELTLARLSERDAEKLVRFAAGDCDLPATLVERLLARGEGVPLFLEEVTKTALTGEIGPAGEAGKPFAETDIPSSLYGCVMARLDRLPEVRQLAQVAATIGHQCPYALLRDVAVAVTACQEHELRQGLQQLVDVQVLERTGDDPESSYVFRHALIQEAASQSLLKVTSRRYHRCIADILVNAFPAMAEAQPEVIARHYTAAAQIPDAIRYWQQAGLQAIQRSANIEAAALLRRALELLLTLPASLERDTQEMAMQVLLAIPLTLTRGWASPDVELAYRQAYGLSRRVGDTPQLFPTLVGLLTYYIVSAQLPVAYDMGLRNLALAERLNDPDLLIEAHYDRCATAMYSGRFRETVEHAQIVSGLYDPNRHHQHVFMYGRDPAAVALVHQAIASWNLGQPDTAIAHGRAAVKLIEAWPHPFTQAWALGGLAAIHEMRGERDTVRDIGQQMIALSSEQGFPNWLAQGLTYVGWAMTTESDRACGIAKMKEGIDIWERTGARLITTYLYYLLADGLSRGGAVEDALAAVTKACALAESTGDVWWLPALCRLHGDILFDHGGDTATITTCYERALTLAANQQAPGLQLRAANGVARVWLRERRQAGIAEMLTPLLGLFTEGLATRDVVEANALLEAAARTRTVMTLNIAP
jgi:class 3 adenylate cyclase/predicted ATPase